MWTQQGPQGDDSYRDEVMTFVTMRTSAAGWGIGDGAGGIQVGLGISVAKLNLVYYS
jgi:hypothetical protein